MKEEGESHQTKLEDDDPKLLEESVTFFIPKRCERSEKSFEKSYAYNSSNELTRSCQGTRKGEIR